MIQMSTAGGLHYNYAHMVLPTLALMNPRKFYEDISGSGGQRYLKTMWLGTAGRMGVSQSPEGLAIRKTNLEDNTELFVIRLPAARQVPEAIYVGVVFRVQRRLVGKDVASARYFTLELGRNASDESDEFHFCEWTGHLLTGRDRSNYGRLPDAHEQSFIEAIRRTLSMRTLIRFRAGSCRYATSIRAELTMHAIL